MTKCVGLDWNCKIYIGSQRFFPRLLPLCLLCIVNRHYFCYYCLWPDAELMQLEWIKNWHIRCVIRCIAVPEVGKIKSSISCLAPVYDSTKCQIYILFILFHVMFWVSYTDKVFLKIFLLFVDRCKLVLVEGSIIKKNLFSLFCFLYWALSLSSVCGLEEKNWMDGYFLSTQAQVLSLFIYMTRITVR